jgi:hypothetical protein
LHRLFIYYFFSRALLFRFFFSLSSQRTSQSRLADTRKYTYTHATVVARMNHRVALLSRARAPFFSGGKYVCVRVHLGAY